MTRLNGWQHETCPHRRCLDRAGDGCECDRRRLLETVETADWSMAPQLWNAVLLQAEREAQYTDRPEAKQGWLRQAARRWIFHGGRDYETVCWWAGLGAGYFRGRVRSKINE